MKGRQIVLDTTTFATPEGDETVEMAALLEDGRLVDLLVDHPDQVPPGTIYRAVADRPVKGQGGMFMQTPDGSGFLRQVKGIAPGDRMLVQVTGYPEPGKALPLTTKILFKSRYAIVTPGAPGMNISRSIKDDDLRDELQGLVHDTFADHAVAARGAGLILRSACAEADPDEVAADVEAMAELAEQVLADEGTDAERLLDGDSAHFQAMRDWERGEVLDGAQLPLKEKRSAFELADVFELAAPFWSGVALSGGGRMYVEATRAAVTVDINTGGDNSPAAGFKANLAAARELPRALRVRGLGGIIYLDLAPMGKKDRRQFETALRAAFKTDAVDTVLAGWTPLGNFELQRKRARLPLDHFAKRFADDLSDL